MAGACLLHACTVLPQTSQTIALFVFTAVLRAGSARCGDAALRAATAAIFWLAGGFCWTTVVAQSALHDRLDPALEGLDLTIRGVIVGLPQRGDHAWTFQFEVEQATTLGAQAQLVRLPRAVRLSLPDTVANQAPRAGERWQWQVRLRRPHGPVNPDGFDAELHALQQGTGATGSIRAGHDASSAPARLDPLAVTPSAVLAALREHVRDAIGSATRGADPTGRGVLQALAIGDQAAVSDRIWSALNRTGIGHLLSISGLHITMLAAMAAALASRLWRLRWIASCAGPARWPRQRVAAGAAVVTAAVYSLLAGWGIPAQRTFWMLAAAALSATLGRAPSLVATLSFAAAIVTLLDPWAPLSAGFWLSFAAVAAIVWAMSRGAARAPRAERFGLRLRAATRSLLSAGTGTQIAATLAMVPLSVAFFGSVSVVGPLMNAVAIPLIAGVLTPATLLGAALASVDPQWGAWLLAPCAQIVAEAVAVLVRVADWSWAAVAIPHPSAAEWALAAVGVACLLGPRVVPFQWGAGFAVLALLLGPRDLPAPAELRITALDVGQGMAVLVESGQHALLYDTGPAWSSERDAGARIVLPYLRARGIDRLDALVVSHGDADHAGGASSLLREISAMQLISSLSPDHPLVLATGTHQPCRAGSTWQWNEVTFRWLHPDMADAESARSGSANARSCVLHIRAPAGSVLLAGDIEAKQEARLLARVPAELLRADVLLAPHHGSRTSSTEAFLRAVAPSWAIFQVGYRNRYHHPHPIVTARYDALGIATLRSDRDGAVTIRLREGQAPDVRRERIDAPRYWRLPWAEPEPRSGAPSSVR